MSWEFWLGIIVTVPIGIFINIATPWIISYFKKSSLSFKSWRIRNFKNQYSRITAYRNNPTELAFECVRLLTYALGRLSILVVIVSFYIIARVGEKPSTIGGVYPFLVGVYLGYVLSAFDDVTRLINQVRDYDKFVIKIRRRLNGLGEKLDDDFEVAEGVKNN